jgi:hypothetical protein
MLSFHLQFIGAIKNGHMSKIFKLCMTLFLDQLPEEEKKKRIEKAKKMPGN